MSRGWFILSLLVAVFLLLLPSPASGGVAAAQEGADLVQATDPATGEPVVQFYLFYSETCPHCHEVMENFLPTVYEKYGDQVEYEYINIYNDTEKYITMLALETKLGVPEDQQGYVPTLIIGDQVLIGGDGIPANLEGLIDQYLAQGGVAFPSLENLPEVVLPTPEPAVQLLVFIDTGHADFEALNAFVSSLAQEYSGQLEPYAIDISVGENAASLAQLNEGLGVTQPPTGTPEILIDHQMLIGLEEIEAKLPGLVEEYLAQGGVQIPPWEELVGGNAQGTATPEGTATPPGEPPAIYLAYFEQAGCQECARTTYDLDLVQEQYPQVVVDRFSIEDAEIKELNAWLCEQYGVPEEKRLSTPMVFVGDEVLIGEEAILQNLLSAVAKYTATGTERIWDDFDAEQGSESILGIFGSLGALTVLGAGLIDGLNPCAFATLVFFISYLAFTGRRGRDILLVGLAFALGVFVTYLLVGVGLLKAIQALPFFTALGRWVYLLTALLCIALAALTFRDYFKAREGEVTEMTLKLPMNLRRRINRVIREGAQMRAFVAVAFGTGFLVSLIELACTGQVYLPTIVYVLSVPELASQAFVYLLLYCLMFILPLIVVFILAYLGTTSEQLGRFVNRHTASIKLATGLVFAGLALWMTWALAPLFGVESPWNWVLMAGVVAIIALGFVLLRVWERRRPKKVAPRRKRSRA